MKTMPYNLSIPTTSSILTSLSQSKALTSMHDKNSVALTTGKIVNTSYDNSTLYFKDMRLTERAENTGFCKKDAKRLLTKPRGRGIFITLISTRPD